MFRDYRYALAATWLLGAVPAYAVDSGDRVLSTVVVTANSTDGNAFTVPHSLTVVTAQDIENAGTSNLGELLSREAGLHLKSFSGGDKNASVDIRGMGDTSVSNVLVMVDGVRLNESDLSGADLSSVDLSAIERIEILRGGGAVRYGDGAVGGVINIITRPPAAGAVRGSVQTELGSYGSRAIRASVGGGSANWRVRASARRALSDGYRQNSSFNRSDGSLEVRYAPTALPADAYVRLSGHTDTYGLPSYTNATAFAGSEADRRRSIAPFDGGSTDDRMLTIGGSVDLGAAGLLELTSTWRDRDNPYIIGYTPLLSRTDQASRIESDRHETQMRYRLDFDALGHTHSLGLGANWLAADYIRKENGENRIGSSAHRIGDLTGRGGYAELTLRGPAGLSLNAGTRANRLKSYYLDESYTQQCDYIIVPPGIPVPVNCVTGYFPQSDSLNTWHNRAYELGLTWEVRPTHVFFVSGSRHFRAPNVDELALATSDLRPQHGVTAEIGIRAQPNANTEYALTLFGMRIKDEVYFGPNSTGGGSLNRNYDQPTRRLGGEFQGRWQLSVPLALKTNLAYVRPRFEDTDADVPHVPRLTMGLGLEWRTSERLRLFADARYVGKRYDGNDPTNRQYPALPAYTVYDMSARYAIGDLEIAAAVNNLFDKVYSTLGYSATYYPMPGRNYALSARWRF